MYLFKDDLLYISNPYISSTCVVELYSPEKLRQFCFYRSKGEIILEQCQATLHKAWKRKPVH